MSKQKGFSLLEVLIALVVVSIALAAMLQGFGVVVQTQLALKEQAVMQQVAWQQWAGLRLGAQTEDKITVQQFGRDWLVTNVKTSTDFPGTQQVVITVQDASDKEARKMQLSALLVAPSKP